MRKLLLFIVIFICLALPTLAKEGHLTLLAVHEEGDQQIGATADLDLEIKAGTGKVFLNTFPLTKIDTQISTRFANSIACDYIDVDCSRYDFFYTIRAESSIIGGPSAGAAVSALTIFLLKDMKYDDKIMLTGTINSGGIVGPIGGLQAKIQAAAGQKARAVLIPKGERNIQVNNKTVDAVIYGNNLNLQVVEVGTLDDVVYEFTGKHVQAYTQDLKIDSSYLQTMSQLAQELCTRTTLLKKSLPNKAKSLTQYSSLSEQAINLTQRGQEALKNAQYYSAASYCFGANVKYEQLIQRTTVLTKDDIAVQVFKVQQNISRMQNSLVSQELKTLTDLQAYIVVSERLNEAKDQISQSLTDNNSQDDLAYAIERIYSAKSWSKFFGSPGKEYLFNEQVLRDACILKIAEAEESYQYVTLFFPNMLQGAQADINDAYKFAANKQYALCLSKAMNAKANSNSVLGVIGVEEQNIPGLIDEKLLVGKQLIIKQAKENSFPILGYSYWEYANSLAKYDKYSALLYAEYGLELSNLDIYFQKKQTGFNLEIDPVIYWVFAFGLCIGLLVGWSIKRRVCPTVKIGKKTGKTAIKGQKRR